MTRPNLRELLIKWDPPTWWNINNDPKSSSDCDQIKAAYVKAQACTICLNNTWLTRGSGMSVSKLVSSAEEACAGCMILSSILKTLAICAGSSSAQELVECFPKQFRWFLRADDLWDIYVPEHGFKEVMVAEDSPLHPSQHQPWRIPHLPRELEVTPYTGSEGAVNRALAWLRDCEENHEACRGTSSKLPSRVIKIQGPNNVKLYESTGKVEPYVCLSHCWGTGSMIQTTTSSLDEYKQGIPWDELPLTFQEAISFTLRLGFQYLWIDSLCIQQDSIEDWRTEGSKMAQIYSGAHVTLAAAASDSSSKGCFRQTPERPSVACSYPNSDGSRLEARIRPLLDGPAWRNAELPLLRRAWTMQECLLSRRLINFTDEELVWGCRTKTACECTFLDHVYNSGEMRSPQRFTEVFHTGAERNPGLWYLIAKVYSGLNLSFEKDIFPALQGISKEMYKYKKSAYVAGLWESSIIPDLLWYVNRPDKVTRPHEWRAPSWSWASIVGPLTWDLRRGLTAKCTYVTAHVVPAGDDVFGQISSAKITLRGRCLQQHVEGSYEPTAKLRSRIKYPKQAVWNFWKDCRQDSWEDCWMERTDNTRPHSTPMAPGERVKTLLFAKDNSIGTRISYLILRPIDTANSTYERIGLMEIWRKDHCSVSDVPLGEEETIHIV